MILTKTNVKQVGHTREGEFTSDEDEEHILVDNFSPLSQEPQEYYVIVNFRSKRLNFYCIAKILEKL